MVSQLQETVSRNKAELEIPSILFSSYSSIGLLRQIAGYSKQEGPRACCRRNNRVKRCLVLQRKEKQPDLTLTCLQGRFSVKFDFVKMLFTLPYQNSDTFTVLVYVDFAAGQILIPSGQLTSYLKTPSHKVSVDLSPWMIKPASQSENWLKAHEEKVLPN